MRLVIRLFAAASLGVSALACDESPMAPGPTPSPTFSSIQRNIFETPVASGVACVDCHTDTGGRAPEGNLVLLASQSYGQLVNRMSSVQPGAVRVVPNDPNGSYLLRKLEGGSGVGGIRMPANGPPYLSAGQIDAVRQWIALGAPNN
jgi:hypothetical protein